MKPSLRTKTTIFIAKNSGLKEKILQIVEKEKISGKIVEVRGEDVPFFVENCIKKGKQAIGITGSDLFKEYMLENYNCKLKILKTIEWQDENTKFGKPTLCLLGPKGKCLEELPRRLKVCINTKYRKIAKRFLNLLEAKGFRFEKFFIAGATEEAFANGLANLVIDIVYSGKSAEEAGLEIYDKISYSDIGIIGGKNEKI